METRQLVVGGLPRWRDIHVDWGLWCGAFYNIRDARSLIVSIPNSLRQITAFQPNRLFGR
jgi:hypothetical protein